jgi:uncharacterized protein YkwD
VRQGWAVVAVAAAAALLVCARPASPAGTRAGDCAPSPSWGTLQPDAVEAQVIQLVNAHRAAMGLATLTLARSLTASAEWKSMNMAGYDYMDHNDPAPVGRTVQDRLGACGYPSTSAGWGENIAYGYATAAAVMNAWLNDPPHRENIEDPSYRTIGVGAARSRSGVVYWTQDFGTTGGSPAPEPPAPATDTQPPPPPSPAPPASPPAPVPVQPSPGETDVTEPDGGDVPQGYEAARAEHGDGDRVASHDVRVNGELRHGLALAAGTAEQPSAELPREETRHDHREASLRRA